MWQSSAQVSALGGNVETLQDKPHEDDVTQLFTANPDIRQFLQLSGILFSQMVQAFITNSRRSSTCPKFLRMTSMGSEGDLKSPVTLNSCFDWILNSHSPDVMPCPTPCLSRPSSSHLFPQHIRTKFSNSPSRTFLTFCLPLLCPAGGSLTFCYPLRSSLKEKQFSSVDTDILLGQSAENSYPLFLSEVFIVCGKVLATVFPGSGNTAFSWGNLINREYALALQLFAPAMPQFRNVEPHTLSNSSSQVNHPFPTLQTYQKISYNYRQITNSKGENSHLLSTHCMVVALGSLPRFRTWPLSPTNGRGGKLRDRTNFRKQKEAGKEYESMSVRLQHPVSFDQAQHYLLSPLCSALLSPKKPGLWATGDCPGEWDKAA